MKLARRTNNNKTKSQLEHFKLRAKQRYDLDLVQFDIDNLIGDIKRNRGTHVESQSLRVSVWNVEIQGKRYNVVYDKNRHVPVTILPPEYVPGMCIDCNLDRDNCICEDI